MTPADTIPTGTTVDHTLPANMRDVPPRPDSVRDPATIEAELLEALADANLHEHMVMPNSFSSGNGWNTLHRDDCGRASGRGTPLADRVSRFSFIAGNYVWDSQPGGFYRVCRCATRELARVAPLIIELKWAQYEQERAERAERAERLAAEEARRSEAAADRATAQATLDRWAETLGVTVDDLAATVARASTGA